MLKEAGDRFGHDIIIGYICSWSRRHFDVALVKNYGIEQFELLVILLVI